MGANKSIFAASNALAPKQPCRKDCPDRKAGCAISCEKWAAYLKQREAYYEKRQKESELKSRTTGNRLAAYRKLKQKKNEPGWH